MHTHSGDQRTAVGRDVERPAKAAADLARNFEPEIGGRATARDGDTWRVDDPAADVAFDIPSVQSQPNVPSPFEGHRLWTGLEQQGSFGGRPYEQLGWMKQSEYAEAKGFLSGDGESRRKEKPKQRESCWQ